MIELVDRVFAGDAQFLRVVGDAPVACLRDASRRDREAMTRRDLPHAFEQRRFPCDVAECQQFVDLRWIDLGAEGGVRQKCLGF